MGSDDEAAGDDERERLVEALRRHVREGRLDLAGFETRSARVYAAETRAAARAALDGLPPLDAGAVRGRRGRHGEAVEVQAHWVRTDEVFRDPTSGRVMRVWADPTDGARHYLRD